MRSYREETDHFSICAASDRGSVKRNNEDYFGIFRPEKEQLLNRKGVLIAVADGMGGLFRGERASRGMIDALGELYFGYQGDNSAETLNAAFSEGNRRVFNRVGEGKEVTAGTTCTAAVLFPVYFHIVHVGDSRAYLLRDGRISQLTEDHSLEKKVYNADRDLSEGRKRTVMTRSVGVREEVETDILDEFSCLKGDRIILCSDGLFSMITDSRIAELAVSESGCLELIRAAKKAGGRDNITVIIAYRI